MLIVTHDGHDAPNDLRLLAPNVLLGDIDAVVLSNTYDENGARGRIPTSVRDQLAAIPGVQEASGIVQRFAPISAGGELQPFSPSASGPPRTPVLFSYHEGSEVSLVAGALPTRADQLLIDRDLADRIDVSVGDQVTLDLEPSATGAARRSGHRGVPRTVSGIFDLPGIDTTGVPLAAVPATQPLEDGTFDRIDLALDPGADLEAVRAAVAGVLGDAYVTLTPTQLGLADQRDAEIGIQHAYWALLSPNAEERYAAREFDGTTREQADEGYARYKDTADQAELRIQRVNFVARRPRERRVPHLLRRLAVADHHRPAERRGRPRRRQVAHRRGHDVPARHLHRSAVRGVRPTSRCNRPTAGARPTPRRRSPRRSVSSPTRMRPSMRGLPRSPRRRRSPRTSNASRSRPGSRTTGSTRAGPSSS